MNATEEDLKSAREWLWRGKEPAPEDICRIEGVVEAEYGVAAVFRLQDRALEVVASCCA